MDILTQQLLLARAEKTFRKCPAGLGTQTKPLIVLPCDDDFSEVRFFISGGVWYRHDVRRDLEDPWARLQETKGVQRAWARVCDARHKARTRRMHDHVQARRQLDEQ